MACKEWSEPKCDSVPIPKAHLAALQTCPMTAENCTVSEPGEGLPTTSSFEQQMLLVARAVF